MKRIILAVLLALGFAGMAHGAPRVDWAKETQARPVLKMTVENLDVEKEWPLDKLEEFENPNFYAYNRFLGRLNDEGPEAKAYILAKLSAERPRVAAVVDPLPQTGGGGHSTALTWVLSTDDTTAACTTTANCLQNVYRAAGSCSASSSFSLLSNVALSSTATAFTDPTVTPGVWCYGVTFGINGLESGKDTVSVTLQPASPSGAAATTK